MAPSDSHAAKALAASLVGRGYQIADGIKGIKLVAASYVATGDTTWRGAFVLRYDAAIAELKQIREDNPGIEFTQLYTSVDYTKDQYESSIAALVASAAVMWAERGRRARSLGVA